VRRIPIVGGVPEERNGHLRQFDRCGADGKPKRLSKEASEFGRHCRDNRRTPHNKWYGEKVLGGEHFAPSAAARWRNHSDEPLLFEVVLQDLEIASIGFELDVEQIADEWHGADHPFDGDVGGQSRKDLARHFEPMRFV
jgi:hypothetical protein